MKRLIPLIAGLVFALSLGTQGAAHAAIHEDEVDLLINLGKQLQESASSEVEKVTSLTHSGRYNEESLKTQLNAFLCSAKNLNELLAKEPIVELEVKTAVTELKAIVLGIDDIFVYESGYDHVRRDWNECKRILRRIDGVVYREGALRSFEKIIDANQWFKEIGYFLGMHGALSKTEDTMHGDKMFKPVNDIVGHHGGGRNTTEVWQIPQPQFHSQAGQDRSAFNEDLSEF
ncbi:MAG TPA: hypothetical protein P5287_05865 [bacterium]|nr:hypothetical protein [bacterium]